MQIYGYCRISTPQQNIERQVRNILTAYPTAHIIREVYTGTTHQGRRELDKLLHTAQAGDAIGAGRGAWQQWELRKRTPSDTALIAASYIFNVSLPYICGVDDEPTPQSMIIPESRLQPMDRNGIEAYLSLTRQEKEFVRKTMDFLQSHRHQQ